MPAVPQEHYQRAMAGFLRRCDAPSTRQAYERELRRFIAWVPEEPGGELLFVYRDYLRDQGLGATSVRWRTTVARAFLRWGQVQGALPAGLVGDYRPPKGKRGFAPRVLSRGELRRLLGLPDRRQRRGKRDAAILVCLGVGGLRAGEVCRLDAEDLSIRGERVVLRVHGKGGKERLVALPGSWGSLFRGYLASWPQARHRGQALFWCGQPGREDKRLTVAAVDYLVRTTAAEAGLGRLSAHALRHTAASLAIDSGEPLHRLRHRLGHSNVMVTSRYLHVADAPHRGAPTVPESTGDGIPSIVGPRNCTRQRS